VWSTKPIPDPTAPNASGPIGMIAPMWLDFDGTRPVAGQVYTETLSDGRFVVQWTDWPRWSEDGLNTFQLILSPSGTIKYQYVDINVASGVFGGPQTGIQNHTGTDGFTIATGLGYIEEGLAVQISATPPFVTDVTPASGTIPAGGSVTVDVTFDATGLVGGTYEGTLTVETDLASEPSTFELPVVLEVTGEAACELSLEPSSFGEVIVGNTATATATVSNAGTDACSLTAASATGPFAVEGFTATELGPGASYSFEVVYEPTSAGADSGTLTVATAEGDLTAALSGMGLGQPTPAVSVDELTLTVIEGQTGSGSFTLSNTGGSGAADLEYEISVVAARPARDARPLGVRAAEAITQQRGAAQHGLRGGSAQRGRIGATLLGDAGIEPGASSGPSPVSYGLRCGGDCDAEPGIIIQDDGSVENGYSANPTVVEVAHLVDLITPPDYPATVTHVCVAFLTLPGGPSTLNFALEFFANDGPGGAPGTLLGTTDATATGIPGIDPGSPPYPLVWQAVDASAAGVTIEEGSVYVGARWVPPSPTNVYLAADESPANPSGYGGG